MHAGGGGAVAYRWARGAGGGGGTYMYSVHAFKGSVVEGRLLRRQDIVHRSRVCGVAQRWPSIMARSERLLPRAPAHGTQHEYRNVRGSRTRIPPRVVYTLQRSCILFVVCRVYTHTYIPSLTSYDCHNRAVGAEGT